MKESLKQTCFDIWNSNDIRKGVHTTFKPLFTRYIGIENNNEYNDILKTFEKKVEENSDISIFFKDEISFPQNFQLMTAVSKNLKTMNVHQFKDDDIVIFNDNKINHIFIESLNSASFKIVADEDILEGGKVVYKKRKNYYPRNARTV